MYKCIIEFELKCRLGNGGNFRQSSLSVFLSFTLSNFNQFCFFSSQENSTLTCKYNVNKLVIKTINENNYFDKLL